MQPTSGPGLSLHHHAPCRGVSYANGNAHEQLTEAVIRRTAHRGEAVALRSYFAHPQYIPQNTTTEAQCCSTSGRSGHREQQCR